MPQKQTPAPVNDWHDVKDDWQDTTDWSDITAPAPVKQNEGLLDKWNKLWINKPLISKETTGGRFDPAGTANYYDDPMQRREDDIRIPHSLPTPFGFNIPIPEALGAGGTLKSLGAGMVEGAGDTLSSFTSPTQLALLLATMGSSAAAKSATTLPAASEFAYRAAPAIARVGRRVAQGLSAPVVAQGGTEIYQGVKEGDYGKAARGVATTAGGVLGMSMPGLPAGAAQEPMPVKPRSTEIPYRYNEAAKVPEATPVTQTPPVVTKAKATKAPKVGKGSQPIPEFDPSTLTGLKTTSGEVIPPQAAQPEVQFVDPKTGEIKPASQAQPGDVVLHEPQSQTEQPAQQPQKANTVADWMRQLLEDEVGAIDPNAEANTPEERQRIREERIQKSRAFRSGVLGEQATAQEPLPVRDVAGRDIAPPQEELPVRPPGPWGENASSSPVLSDKSTLKIPYREPRYPASQEVLPPETAIVEPGMDPTTSAIVRDTQRMRDDAYRASQDPEKVAARKKTNDDWNATQKNLRINSFLEKALHDPNSDDFPKGYGDMSPGQQAQYDDVFNKINEHELDVENPNRDNGFKARIVDANGNEVDLIDLASGNYKPESTAKSQLPRLLDRLKDERGSFEWDPKQPGSAARRMQELFEKNQSGTLTPDELAEAKQLAKSQVQVPEQPVSQQPQRRATKKISGMDLGPTLGGELPVRQPGVAEQQAAPELSTSKKTSRTYLEGASKVDTGPLVPENQSAKKVTNTLGNRLQKATGQGSGGGTKPPKPALLGADALNPDIPIEEHKTQAPFKTRYGAVGEVLNAPRTLQSIDLPGLTSAALRQTRPLAFTTDWFKAWGAGVKAFGSKGALDLIKSEIENGKYMQPQYQPVLDKTGQVIKYVEKPSRAESLGLKMGDIFSTREETLANSLAERIPGYGRYVKASNRANQAFINQLRYAKFEKMMDGAEAAGRGADDVLGRKIADFANRATGRGGLGVLEPLAEEIGLALYSPRALSARLQFVNPYNYTKMDPLVRNEYWKGLARLAGSWMAFSTLGSLIPKAHVSLDPNNADFGKVRVRNTRVDPGAGWQQLMVLAHRELPQVAGGGGTVSSSGAPGQKGKFTPFGSTPMASTRLSLAGRYAYNMLSPSARFGYDLANVSKKEPFDLTDRTLQLALPMYAADIADAAKDDPGVAEIFAPLLSSMGAGVNTYEKGDFNKPKITPLIKKATGKKVPTMVFGGR